MKMEVGDRTILDMIFTDFTHILVKKLCYKGVEIEMRDRTHIEHVERWACFVRDNPRSIWKAELKPFIDAQIIMANRFYSRLEKMPGGKEKIRKLRGLE